MKEHITIKLSCLSVYIWVYIYIYIKHETELHESSMGLQLYIQSMTKLSVNPSIFNIFIHFSESNAHMMPGFFFYMIISSKRNRKLNFQNNKWNNNFDRLIMQNRKWQNYSYSRKYHFKLIDLCKWFTQFYWWSFLKNLFYRIFMIIPAKNITWCIVTKELSVDLWQWCFGPKPWLNPVIIWWRLCWKQ